MKKLLLICLLILFYNNVNSQYGSISGAKPIIANPEGGNPFPLNYNQNGNQEYTLNCGITEIELLAQFNNVGATDSYIVESIPYAPRRFGYEPVLPGGIITITQDDIFSSIINFESDNNAFDFCFFQNSYNNFVINDNSVITFDLSYANQVVGGNPTFGGWRLFYNSAEAAIAGTNLGDPIRLNTNGNQFLLNNAIFLPAHDLFTTSLPAESEFYWNIYGTKPNRKLVIGLLDIPMFSCSTIKTSHQIIIYETTNIIETHIQELDICDSWNPGNGEGYSLIGIQNNDRNISFTAPNRDTGSWTANFESWRFIPNGSGTLPVFAWYENYDHLTNTGTLISTNPQHTFSPISNITYTAEVRYTNPCSGEIIIETQDVDLLITEFEDSSFSYSDTYAISDANPIPTNIVTLGGVFSIDNGAIINPTTGEIDLTSTIAGATYSITYTIGGMCPSSSTFTINIVETAIDYPNAVVEISGNNPIPTITISGGTFTINNGASINEATGEVFLNTTTVNTTYTITYTYENSRINTYTFELTVVNTLAIEDDILNNNVSIFPNPTKNVFTLKNEGNFKLEKLEVISYLGKLIKTIPLTNVGLEKQISIKNLTSGVYFIKITSKNGKISKKLIVR